MPLRRLGKHIKSYSSEAGTYKRQPCKFMQGCLFVHHLCMCISTPSYEMLTIITYHMIFHLSCAGFSPSYDLITLIFLRAYYTIFIGSNLH